MAVLASAACSALPGGDDAEPATEDAVKAAARSYTEAYIAQDGGALHERLSQACRDRWSEDEWAGREREEVELAGRMLQKSFADARVGDASVTLIDQRTAEVAVALVGADGEPFFYWSDDRRGELPARRWVHEGDRWRVASCDRPGEPSEPDVTTTTVAAAPMVVKESGISELPRRTGDSTFAVVFHNPNDAIAKLVVVDVSFLAADGRVLGTRKAYRDLVMNRADWAVADDNEDITGATTVTATVEVTGGWHPPLRERGSLTVEETRRSDAGATTELSGTMVSTWKRSTSADVTALFREGGRLRGGRTDLATVPISGRAGFSIQLWDQIPTTWTVDYLVGPSNMSLQP